MTELYSTTPTLILSGNTSNAKTTTINSLLKNLVNLKCDFYTDVRKNSTKITTIFHFNSEINKLELFNEKNILVSEESFQSENESEQNGFEEMISRYNENTTSHDIINGEFHVYIKTNKLRDIILIDTIGISNQHVESKHAEVMTKLKKYYINHIMLIMSC